MSVFIWLSLGLSLILSCSSADNNAAALSDWMQSAQLAFLPIQLKSMQPDTELDQFERHLPQSNTWQSLFGWPFFPQPKKGANVQPQLSVTPVKQWTEDDSTSESMPSSSIVPELTSVDVLGIFDQILVDDGHDRESVDETNLSVQPTCSKCGCCSACQANAQEGEAFNDKVDLLLQALQSNLKETGVDPMPLRLKKVNQPETRSRRDTAELSDLSGQPKTPAQTAAEQNQQPQLDSDSDAQSRLSKDSTSEDKTVPRVHGILKGLATIKKEGDVKTTILPGGIRMLRTKVQAGPLYLQLARTSENRDGDLVTYQTAMIPKLEGELSLKLKRNGGIEIHSLRFDAPKEAQIGSPVREKAETQAKFDLAFLRRSRRHPLQSFAAVAAQNVRDTLRYSLARGIPS